MNQNQNQAYRRVTDLFVEGDEVVLHDRTDEPVCVWVQKLNPFQREEAVRDGQVGRSRVQLALRSDQPSDELTLFRGQMQSMPETQLQSAIVDSQYADLFVDVQTELRADPEWSERLDVIERSDEQLTGRDPDDPEVVATAQLHRDYLEEMERRTQAKRDQRLADLDGLKADELRRRYEDSYIEQKGSAEFLTQYRVTELYFAARACFATRDPDRGGWTHQRCDHTQRLFTHRNQVRDAPAELLERLREALDRLHVAPRDAKNSDRQGSSSESSPLPKTPAASTASGPEDSPELVGISPSPSPTP